MCKTRSLTLIVLCIAGSALAQTTVYVDGSVAATGDGTQAAPFQTIAEALELKDADLTVLVAGGTYANEPNNTDILSGQTLIGSYDSSFTTSDSSVTPTIIDMARPYQEQNGAFTMNGAKSWTIMNLVIRNSSTGEHNDTENGGAMYIRNGSQGTLRGVTFFNCTARFEGGSEGGTARDGGALCIRDDSTVVMEDCVFDGCTAVGQGGAMRMRSARGAGNDVRIRRCLFTNCGSRNGASVIDDADGASQIEIVNCIFAYNGVDVPVPSGTAPSNYEIRVADKRALIYNCTFVGSNNPDGFMFDVGDSGNEAGVKSIINCIIADSTIASGGSNFAIFRYVDDYNDVVTIENNLFYSNSGLDPLDYTGAAIIGVNGNIAGDPEFVDAANGDYHLKAGSPGEDAGKTLALVADDFAGTARPVGSAYDIGALEGQGMNPKVRSVVATASSSLNANSGPEKTVDESGLDDLDRHDERVVNMWVSAAGQQPPVWIKYEFNEAYKLDEMWVWNSNSELEWYFGWGVKTATIEYSTDDTKWIALTDVPEFTPAPGAANYDHNTTVDFGGVVAKYVRVTCTSSWGGEEQYGLSEVRFFYIPVIAGDPKPAPGATGVPLDTTLSWRAGREAALHQVYFGTDSSAVADGAAPVDVVDAPAYSVGNLNPGTTYYWRIDEVNEAATPSVWEGPAWSFTTQEFISVDDFESYSGAEDHEIFSTWSDGYGDGTNGSQAGHDDPPYVEQTVVHGGGKSMPLYYGKGGVSHSEVSLPFDPAQDWTRAGVSTLTFYVHGRADNVGAQFYVKVNGVAKAVDVDFAAEDWQEVNIELASFGVDLDLQSVISLAFSIEGAGSGWVFVDDIRLSP